MNYSSGSLIRARGREWLVLPGSDKDFLYVRPLGGGDDEETGIATALEKVEAASFSLPDPTDLGDYRSSRMLRDALRLGFRSSAGPFRSFGRIAVEPRPYQLVPLLMALKLDPVRLLIADDVGIGKTVEACLIARELLDRGEVERLAVLCPPQLVGQWQVELARKFHIEAELVLPGTAARLERDCLVGQSLFEKHPYVIVSLDFIKSDRRLDEFLRACPELVIVDEAHGCVQADGGRVRQQRYRLLKGLAQKTDRHMVLVTATPHSGKEEAFRSLLSLLKPEFANLPDDLGGEANKHHRKNLAAHFVQRRRADIRHFMKADTPFPERLYAEEEYRLTPEYAALFEKVIAYARETIDDPRNVSHRQRVKWWSALALLRSLASSPAAAAETLRNRAATADTETVEDADEVGRRTVLDLMDESTLEGTDIAPGTDIWDESKEDEKKNRRRLLDMARQADALVGDKDEKLKKAVGLVKQLVKDGFCPIVFCRFIPTAEYVSKALQQELSRTFKDIEVQAVTGKLAPEDRESRVAALGKSDRHVLVCTDCLSEGINLQEHFDAVFHYDLPWNPTRLEQREGRVDRYLQPRKEVRAVTYYGIDNRIDGIVLDVLLKKHRAIKNALGISVPIPIDTEKLIEAVFEGLILRGGARRDSGQMRFEEFFETEKQDLFKKWDSAKDVEQRSRTLFAQETIKPEEVAPELHAAQVAVGLGVDVESFTRYALQANKAFVSNTDPAQIDLSEVPRPLRELLGGATKIEACFNSTPEKGQVLLTRTHPFVEALSSYIVDTALDPLQKTAARRCGVIRTNAVSRRITALLVRMRFHLVKKGPKGAQTFLAEECGVLAFSGAPGSAEWLSRESSEALLAAEPSGNISPDQAADFVKKVTDTIGTLMPHIEREAGRKADELLEAHTRVRKVLSRTGISYKVSPHLPVDILGIYVYLPAAGAAS